MIELHVLGPAQVEVNGRTAPPELLWRKHLGLLLYLARSPRRTRTRDQLAGIFWSDKPEAAARHSLNEALRVLRRAAGDAAIETRNDQISLSPDVVRMDLEEFEAAAGAGDLGRAADLVQGVYMEGFAVPGASGFEDWLAAERAHWTDRSVAVLAAWSNALAEQGRLSEAGAVAERGLVLSPTDEGSLLALLRALALGGERARVLQRAESYRAGLAERLGVEPSARVTGLVDRVRHGRRFGPPAGAAAPAAEAAGRRFPLVGRGAELAKLVEVWEAAREGLGSAILLIEGETGSGKSRLAEEVAARATLDGAVVCSARAVSGDEAEEWSGVLTLARGGLLEVRGLASSPPPALDALARELPAWRERYPAVQGGEGLSPGRALREIAETVTAEQALVLLVDGAEHLDRSSLHVLAALPRDLPQARLLVGFIAASFPPRGELDELRAALGRSQRGVAIALGALDAGALHDLVAWAMPGYSASEVERLTRRLAADSAGLPLLTVELLHAVACGMELGADAGAWPEPSRTLDQSLPGDLPAPIIAALRVGFRRLSAGAQQVLAAASLLGERVSPADLARATALGSDAVSGALDELEWARWLVAEPRGYAFVARVARDVVAQDMMTPGQRRRILASAASAPNGESPPAA